MTEAEFDAFVTAKLPHFVAVKYQQMLDAAEPRARVQAALDTYDLGLRALTIGLVSQYLIHDQATISDPYVNDLLIDKFPHVTLHAWLQLLFATLRAYEGQRDLLFMPELYDFYWDTSTVPHRARPEVRAPFDRLTQIKSDLDKEDLRPADQAGWTRLADEATSLLRQILNLLSFLAQYDMIRVVRSGNCEYEYELHKGITVTNAQQPTPDCAELGEGWFYLRRSTNQLLQLHPFLIAWQDEAAPPLPAAPAAAAVAADIGVYDRFINEYERLQYLLTTLGQTVFSKAYYHAYISVIVETIAEYKRQRQEAARLTWSQLQDLCAEITRVRTDTMRRRKYDPARYLPRAEAHEAFMRFLRSDARCFVLTGKSAVGKTNVLLALVDELAARGDVAVLSYDGGQAKIEPSLTGFISKDFDDRLRLPDRRIENIWREMAGLDGMEQRQVVLIVDALNENPQAREFLRQLDELVAGPWPWLKVIISSRPETWRNTRQKLTLTEGLYYQAAPRAAAGGPAAAELEPFSASYQLDPFSVEELPAAYARYQAAYGLTTPFESLPHDVRQLLRDPLNLWLTARMYGRQGQGQNSGAIPANLRARTLVQNYVEAADILSREDLRLLQTQIVPLFGPPGLRSELLTADIEQTGGASLYNAIFDEQMLSDGTQRNQSFENLVDAGILMLQGQGARERIVFACDRFYDYFVGKYLFETNPAAAGAGPAERARHYDPLIAALPERVHVWGALVQALIRELEGNGPAVIAALAPRAEHNPLLCNALSTALVSFGEDHLPEARAAVKTLLEPLESTPDSNIGRMAQLLKPKARAESKITMQQVIGLTVAAQLGLTEFLEAAAADLSPALRTAGVLYTFYLWRQNPALGFQVVEALGRRAAGPLRVPDLGATESVLGLTAAILGQAHDPATAQRFLDVGRRTTREVLLLPEAGTSRGSRLPEFTIRFVRERVVDVILMYVTRTLSSWGNRAWASFDNMTHIFALSAEQKALVKRLAPLLDPATPGLADHVPEMLTVEEWGDAISQCIVEFSLLSHAKEDFAGTLPVLKQVIAAGVAPRPAKFWAYGPTMSLLWAAARQDAPDPVIEEITTGVVAAIQEDPARWLEQARRARPVPIQTDCRATPLGQLAWARYLLGGRIEAPALTTYLQAASTRRDTEYLVQFLTIEVPIMLDFGWYPAAFMGLLPLLDDEDPQVREGVVRALVRIHRHQPEQVEEWLAQHDAPPEIVQRVLAYPATEQTLDLMTYQLLWIFFDLFLWGAPALRRVLQYHIRAALELPDIRTWLRQIVKDQLNLIAGEVVFPLPADAPSQALLATPPVPADPVMQGR